MMYCGKFEKLTFFFKNPKNNRIMDFYQNLKKKIKGTLFFIKKCNKIGFQEVKSIFLTILIKHDVVR